MKRQLLDSVRHELGPVAVLVNITPVGSSDIASYAAYGRIAALGYNPYTFTPSMLPGGKHNPYTMLVSEQWREILAEDYSTSADVVHGFFVGETNTNAMVVPGFISDVRTQFARTGEYKMPCDEFCGYGHHAMAARVVVVPKEEFQNASPEERVSCGAQ